MNFPMKVEFKNKTWKINSFKCFTKINKNKYRINGRTNNFYHKPF